MNWQTLIIISTLLYSIINLLQRVIVKDSKIDPALFATVFQLLTALLIGVFGLYVNRMAFPDIKPFIGNLLLMTLLYGMGSVFMYASLRLIEASHFAIIFSSRIIFTILASSVILQEGLTVPQLVGTFLILLGIVVINIKKEKWGFGKGEFFALLLSICFGFQLTNDSFVLKSFPLYPYTFISFLFPGIFLALFNISKMSQVTLFLDNKLLYKMLLINFLYAIAIITFYQSLQLSGNSSQIGAISLLSVIITVLLAIIFLKERQEIGKKILGALFSLVGLSLLNS